MFSQRTVFVLGAGASMPYGFPSGADLERAIIKNLANPDGEWAAPLRETFNITVLTEFHRALRWSRAGSVDAFLEFGGADFLAVGKACIARALIPLENDDALFADRRDAWYDCLWRRLRGRDEDEFLNAQVTFITFNYDRSLEYYLYRTVTNLYGVDGPTARHVLGGLPVLHVHGCLGELVYDDQEGPGRRFSPEVDADILQCADRIRIVHEAAEDDPVFDQAREALSKAEVICVLGFGFNDVNVSRLAPARWTATKQVATCIGLSGRRQAEVRNMIQRLNLLSHSLTDFVEEVVP